MALSLCTEFFCPVIMYFNGEETENELSLVIWHAINYFVGISDLVNRSVLSGYSRKRKTKKTGERQEIQKSGDLKHDCHSRECALLHAAFSHRFCDQDPNPS